MWTEDNQTSHKAVEMTKHECAPSPGFEDPRRHVVLRTCIHNLSWVGGSTQQSGIAAQVVSEHAGYPPVSYRACLAVLVEGDGLPWSTHHLQSKWAEGGYIARHPVPQMLCPLTARNHIRASVAVGFLNSWEHTHKVDRESKQQRAQHGSVQRRLGLKIRVAGPWSSPSCIIKT